MSDYPLIDLRSVCKRYGLGTSEVHALRGVDLRIEKGEFVALCGPSGSGKTTLLNICGLIDTLDEGGYSFDGRDVGNLSQRALTAQRKHSIGFIFQGFNLLPIMTVYENVEYPLTLLGVNAARRREQVRSILERVGLWSLRKQFPEQISGGQKQRAAIARALIKQPALVIADEPTANLDTATATNTIDLMRELRQQMQVTFVIATHDERMTSRCDRSIHLVDGQLQ